MLKFFVDFDLPVQRFFHPALFDLALLKSFDSELDACWNMNCEIDISISAFSNLVWKVYFQICNFHISQLFFTFIILWLWRLLNEAWFFYKRWRPLDSCDLFWVDRVNQGFSFFLLWRFWSSICRFDCTWITLARNLFCFCRTLVWSCFDFCLLHLWFWSYKKI